MIQIDLILYSLLSPRVCVRLCALHQNALWFIVYDTLKLLNKESIYFCFFAVRSALTCSRLVFLAQLLFAFVSAMRLWAGNNIFFSLVFPSLRQL